MDRTRHGWHLPAALALSLAAAVLVAEAPEPALGVAPREATPAVGVEPAERRARDGRDCPSIAEIDPGFSPSLPDHIVVGRTPIDPGFSPRPGPPPGEIAGERRDPGFVAPFPPCDSPAASPEAPDR